MKLIGGSQTPIEELAQGCDGGPPILAFQMLVTTSVYSSIGGILSQGLRGINFYEYNSRLSSLGIITPLGAVQVPPVVYISDWQSMAGNIFQ